MLVGTIQWIRIQRKSHVRKLKNVVIITKKIKNERISNLIRKGNKKRGKTKKKMRVNCNSEIVDDIYAASLS
jgi:hypothetical protein